MSWNDDYYRICPVCGYMGGKPFWKRNGYNVHGTRKMVKTTSAKTGKTYYKSTVVDPCPGSNILWAEGWWSVAAGQVIAAAREKERRREKEREKQDREDARYGL